MTDFDIKKYYKIIGYINLGFSLLSLFFMRENDWQDRIIAVIGINMAYHMLYLFYSSIYINSTKMRSNNSFNKNVGGIMLGLFAMFGMFGSLFLIYIFIYSAISSNEYYRLFTMCIPFGLFLGAYSLWNDLKKE
ncbi:hypothetical protein [Winogradskyella psychrotolerans]|uniref:hypothetical protein n=1 Tax=Winogradskyella psychrotolerans TaxID=1344585 RepID=UPI001C067813|nr:hypothetical protein [Winogradskyella psychrotolerans]MBU2930262.1 hypothetical protein [Winogradskyella psychrotolerans]